MSSYYLGFDAGTQSVKVVVYDADRNCVAQTAHPTEIRHPRDNWVEMDADGYVELVMIGIKECVEQMRSKGLDPADIRAVEGDGIICGIVGVDPDGNAITPYINYLDSRTDADVKELSSRGLSIWAEETGNAEPNVMFPAMFARWFLRNSEPFKERGAKFVHNCPYILMHLAGLKAEDAFIDQGTMSGWGLGYRVMKKEWSDEQLSILGIDRRYMPRIVKAWDIIGHTTQEVCERTGLPAGIPVCGGAGDTMQSMIGCGLLTSGRAADVAGTCSMFCVSTDGIVPELSKAGSGLIFNSGTRDDTYFYWGFVRSGGLAISWFKRNVGEGLSYEELEAKAKEVPAGSNGVLFVPYMTGGESILERAKGCFLYMDLDTDRYVMWRAVLESIGYDYMSVTDVYRAAGVDLSTIMIAEGGSVNSLWNQIKADMIGSRAVTTKASGGAILTDCVFAAYAVGDITDLQSVLEMITETDREFAPVSENTAMYRKRYEHRQQLAEGRIVPPFV